MSRPSSYEGIHRARKNLRRRTNGRVHQPPALTVHLLRPGSTPASPRAICGAVGASAFATDRAEATCQCCLTPSRARRRALRDRDPFPRDQDPGRQLRARAKALKAVPS